MGDFLDQLQATIGRAYVPKRELGGDGISRVLVRFEVTVRGGDAG